MNLGDVELSKNDEARIERLSRRANFDDTDAEAIVRFAKLDRDDRDPNDIADFVSNGATDDVVFDGLTEDECAGIRRAMTGANRTADVVDQYPDKHPSVVFRHAQGRCGHDIEQSATTSPRIKADECRDMRVAFQGGDTVEDIRADFHRSANAVNRHVFGRCDHTFEPDTKHAEVDTSACAAIRAAYKENTTATVADVARAFLRPSGTTHRHLRGECDHDVDEAPVRSSFDGYVTPGECGDMRKAYVTGLTCQDLADDVFDRDYQVIRKHVYGRCGHDHDVDPLDSGDTRVSKQDCANVRQAYKYETDTTIDDLLTRFGIGKGTLYYHAMGKCAHGDSREEPASTHRE